MEHDMMSESFISIRGGMYNWVDRQDRRAALESPTEGAKPANARDEGQRQLEFRNFLDQSACESFGSIVPGGDSEKSCRVTVGDGLVNALSCANASGGRTGFPDSSFTLAYLHITESSL